MTETTCSTWRLKLSQKPNDSLFTIYELNAFDSCEYTRGWMSIISEIRQAESDGTFDDAVAFFCDRREGYMPMPRTATDLRNNYN